MSDTIEDLPVTLRPFVPFREWWKVDDKAWVEQRKAEWKRLKKNWPFKEYDAVVIKALARFYVFGEEPPRTEENILHKAFPTAMDRFLLTPYSSPEDARRLFEAFSHSSSRGALLVGFLPKACTAFNGMPYARQKVKAFCEGVLGDEYCIITANIGSPKLNRTEVISPPAGFFSTQYIAIATKFIRGEHENDYSYVIDTVPYFISALRYMERHDEEVDSIIEKLVKLVMNCDEAALNDLQRELAQRLRAAFEADDAPACIKQYLGK